MLVLVGRIFFLIGVLSAAPGICAAEESKNYTCFSMQAAARVIQEDGASDTVKRLGDISRIVGLLVDPATRDWILVGERDPSRPPLHLDDLVVLLRSTYMYQEWEAPGVTINPAMDRAGMFRREDQEVVYFGHVENSRCGKVLFDADVLMKKIGLGLVDARVHGVEPYFDLAVAELTQATERARRTQRQEDIRTAYDLITTEVCSRFWYYPVVSRVVTVGNGVLLHRSQLAVLPQVLAVRQNGRILEDVQDFHHGPSERFADSFSSHFDELGQEWPVIRDLEGIASLSAVVRGLAKTEVNPDLTYWLHSFPVAKKETDTRYPLQENTHRATGFSVFGGVHLHALSVRLKEGDIEAFAEAVLEGKSRSGGSVTWQIVLTPQRDLYTVQALEVRSQEAVEFWVRGEYLYQAGKYDLAIANWRQVAKLYPDMSEVHYRIAQAFEKKGLTDAAADYYSRALEADPFFRNLAILHESR